MLFGIKIIFVKKDTQNFFMSHFICLSICIRWLADG